MLLALTVGTATQLAPLATTPLVAAELPAGATLTILAEPVEVAPAGAGVFASAIAGQSLSAGDVVRTGSSGMALLTFFDGSESQMGTDAQVQIEQADYSPAPQIALLQTSGVSVNRVIPLPPGGSFRTDTPEATGLVRGTSYVVTVGSMDDNASATSMVLLTDRDGHVGHVQVVASPGAGGTVDPPRIELMRAGDVGAAAHHTTSASHVEAHALAQLERAARDLYDAGQAHVAHARAREVMHAAVPRAAAATARAGGDSGHGDQDLAPAPHSARPQAAAPSASTPASSDSGKSAATSGNTDGSDKPQNADGGASTSGKSGSSTSASATSGSGPSDGSKSASGSSDGGKSASASSGSSSSGSSSSGSSKPDNQDQQR